MYKLDFKRAEEPQIKLPTSVGSQGKQGNSRKTIYFCFIDYTKAFDRVDHNKLWKILQFSRSFAHCLKRWEYQTTLPVFWETSMPVKNGTTDCFKIGKGICQGCILSPCLFNFYTGYIKQNARLDESQAGINIVGRNINNLRYADDIPL